MARAKKKKEDDGKPKRASPAYMFFANKKRPTIVQKHPEMSFGEVGAELGRLWREMSDKEKEPYAKLAAEDKVRYANELSTWQKQQGKGK